MSKEQEELNRFTDEFLKAYYTQFDQDKNAMGNFFHPQGTLTFEGKRYTGLHDIHEHFQEVIALHSKLTKGLRFGKIAHQISSKDAQVNGMGNGAIISVTGQVKVDDEENPQLFTEMFHIVQAPDGSGYLVINNIFRLVYAI